MEVNIYILLFNICISTRYQKDKSCSCSLVQRNFPNVSKLTTLLFCCNLLCLSKIVNSCFLDLFSFFLLIYYWSHSSKVNGVQTALTSESHLGSDIRMVPTSFVDCIIHSWYWSNQSDAWSACRWLQTVGRSPLTSKLLCHSCSQSRAQRQADTGQTGRQAFKWKETSRKAGEGHFWAGHSKQLAASQIFDKYPNGQWWEGTDD